MPKIFEYMGIIIRFWSDEHTPIHVHAFYGKTQVKVEITIVNNKITEIQYKKVKGYKILPDAKMKDLKTFIEEYKGEIVNLWIKCFVLHIKMKNKKITPKIK